MAGIAIAVLPGPALTVGVLLAPALLFYPVEPGNGHPITRAMLLFGSTMLVRPLHELWSHDGSLGAALDLLADPACPLLAWVACGVGWLSCELAHATLRLTSQLSARRQTRILEREKQELQAEWMNDAA